MAEILDIKITDDDLINGMPDRNLTAPKAKKIIEATKKVLIEGIEWKEKSRTSTSITVEAPSNLIEEIETKKKSRTPTSTSVEAPSNLSEESWSVVLLCREAEEDQIIAILNYDPAKKKFPAPVNDDDDDKEEDLNKAQRGGLR